MELQDAEKGFLEMKESLEVEDQVNLKINIKKNEMLAILRLVLRLRFMLRVFQHGRNEVWKYSR